MTLGGAETSLSERKGQEEQLPATMAELEPAGATVVTTKGGEKRLKTSSVR